MKIYISPANHHKPYIIKPHTEKEQMEKVGKLVVDKLRKYENVEVFYPTVFSADQSYKGRPEEAKKLKADVYLAIHSNASAIVGQKATGAVGFYHKNNYKSKQLATNLADVLDEICPIESNRASSVIDGMSMFNGYGLGEVREPTNLGMISCLIETNFHSYEPTAKYILENTDKIAEGIVKAVTKTFDLAKKNQSKPNPNACAQKPSSGCTSNGCSENTNSIYRIQVSAFSNLNETAKNFCAELNKLGYDTIIVKFGKVYRVQVGAFRNKSYALNTLSNLKSLGYSGFVTTQSGEIVYSSKALPKDTQPASTTKNIPYKGGKFKVTSPFGYRLLNGKYENHIGLDLVGVSSPNITSTVNGTVVRSRIVTDPKNKTSEWGEYVSIQSDTDSTIHTFAHMKANSRIVKVGDKVKVGQVIGEQGNTGKSYGVHCHYQIVASNGVVLNPATFLGIANKTGTYQL